MKEIKLPISYLMEALKPFKDAERGRIFTAMLLYAATGQSQEFSGNERYAWVAVKGMVDKQRAISSKRAEAGKKGMESRWGGITNDNKTLQTITNDSKTKTRESLPPIPPYKEKYIYNTQDTVSIDSLLSSCDEVIDFLNQVIGGKYKHSESSRKHIRARLNDGFTVDDCKKVIRNRWKQWRGTEYQQYMRPDTLFRESNFEAYLNAPDNAGAKARPGRNTLKNYNEEKRNTCSHVVLDLDEL